MTFTVKMVVIVIIVAGTVTTVILLRVIAGSSIVQLRTEVRSDCLSTCGIGARECTWSLFKAVQSDRPGVVIYIDTETVEYFVLFADIADIDKRIFWTFLCCEQDSKTTATVARRVASSSRAFRSERRTLFRHQLLACHTASLLHLSLIDILQQDVTQRKRHAICT